MNKNDHFFSRVYAVTKQIPYGRVTTYGAIARYLGSPQSSRMVGWALNQSRFDNTFIPAHRVVNRSGILSGKRYFGGQKVMEELLKSEGIEVKDDQIIRFGEVFWDPVKELGL